MAGVNKVILLGNLGNDPEVKQIGESTVCNFSMATSEKYADKKTGEIVETTEWHNIVMWNGPAKVAGVYLKKGSKCYIEGKLKTRSWEAEDGTTKYMTEILGHTLQLLGDAKK